MSALTTIPKFLYPTSRQFPFDEVAEEIVRALERRNFKVPGITIDFDIYGSGEAKFQLVRKITGDNFRLYFSRVQAKLNSKTYDHAGLSSVCIPKEILEVYEDESGPVYYLYVGNNWEADKEWFRDSIKVHSKLNQEPRRYLCYRGNTYKKRADELVFDDDLGREHSPEGNEPVRIDLDKKYNEITEWLKKYVLEYILTFPEVDVKNFPIPFEELIPYKGPWSTVFSICNYRDAKRIKQGKQDPSKLLPEDRHAKFGDCRRLVPLSIKRNDIFPEISYAGFIWCDVNQEEDVTEDYKFSDAVVSAMKSSTEENYIVGIKLKYSNEVYVVDNSKYEDTSEEGDAYAARGATIIPITEYTGGYKDSIVLINRELEFDEISWGKRIKK